jgi:signal transduction histidine kinase
MASLSRFANPGRGIDPEHVERVFEAFYTGMGLSICRSIVNAHGGPAP